MGLSGRDSLTGKSEVNVANKGEIPEGVDYRKGSYRDKRDGLRIGRMCDENVENSSE